MNYFNDIANQMLNIFDFGMRHTTNLQNYNLQKDIFKWQKKTQQDIFNRDDNAVQRRVADLQAAGLSPTLAAGSAAGTSGAVHANVPHKEHASFDNILLGATIRKTMADYAQTMAQTKLTEQQARAQAIDNKTKEEFNISNIQNIKENLSHLRQQIKESDARIGYTEANIRHFDIQRELAKGNITHMQAQDKEIVARIEYIKEQMKESMERRETAKTTRYGQELDNLIKLRGTLHDLIRGIQSKNITGATNIGTWWELIRGAHQNIDEKELDRMIMEMLKSETYRRYPE
ncbi:DNA pilot protein [Tortoise microvirus 30]|nr:DNA pilot protein [Tortoise microvirus 30]